MSKQDDKAKLQEPNAIDPPNAMVTPPSREATPKEPLDGTSAGETDRDYVERIKTQLDEWGAELADLEERFRQGGDEVTASIKERYQALRTEYAGVQERFERLLAATEESWTSLANEVDYAWKALRGSFNYFRSHYQESVRSRCVGESRDREA